MPPPSVSPAMPVVETRPSGGRESSRPDLARSKIPPGDAPPLAVGGAVDPRDQRSPAASATGRSPGRHRPSHTRRCDARRPARRLRAPAGGRTRPACAHQLDTTSLPPITAGCRSIMPFQTERAASYSASLGRTRVPRSSCSRAATSGVDVVSLLMGRIVRAMHCVPASADQAILPRPAEMARSGQAQRRPLRAAYAAAAAREGWRSLRADVRDVAVDGVLAEHEPRRDLRVAQSIGDEADEPPAPAG